MSSVEEDGMQVSSNDSSSGADTPTETLRERVARLIVQAGDRVLCLQCLAAETGLTYRQIHTALRGTGEAYRIHRYYGRCPVCNRSRLLYAGPHVRHG
jgi:hypothetical protein